MLRMLFVQSVSSQPTMASNCYILSTDIDSRELHELLTCIVVVDITCMDEILE